MTISYTYCVRLILSKSSLSSRPLPFPLLLSPYHHSALSLTDDKETASDRMKNSNGTNIQNYNIVPNTPDSEKPPSSKLLGPTQLPSLIVHEPDHHAIFVNFDAFILTRITRPTHKFSLWSGIWMHDPNDLLPKFNKQHYHSDNVFLAALSQFECCHSQLVSCQSVGQTRSPHRSDHQRASQKSSQEILFRKMG